MSKRARRLARKNEFQAVENAIGVSLGKKPAEPKKSSIPAGLDKRSKKHDGEEGPAVDGGAGPLRQADSDPSPD
jgi:hypothetical protein